MDETDHKKQKPSQSTCNSNKSDKIIERPKIFCCGSDTLTNVKTLLNRPGQAVQIVTDSSGTHTIEHEDEVGECSISTIKLPATVGDSRDCNSFGMNKLAYLSDNHLDCIAGRSNGDGFNESENNFETLSEAGMPSTSDRCQNDLIKFVFTSHGIRVISDKEYVV